MLFGVHLNSGYFLDIFLNLISSEKLLSQKYPMHGILIVSMIAMDVKRLEYHY